jgi:protein SCO1
VPTRVALALTTLVICAAAGVFGVWLATRGEESAAAGFEGAVRPPGARMPDFALTNQDGEPVTAASLRGRPVVFAFVYSTCKDVCPAQVQSIRGALDDLGHDVPAIAISVDPPNDTPASARKFLAEQRANGRIRFVLGSRAELRPVWRRYGITPQRVTQEHLAHITLVDARGFQRVGYPISQATPERLAHDLRLLERDAG